MGADTGRAKLRLGPNIRSQAAESLLDTSMSECRLNLSSERRFAAEEWVMPTEATGVVEEAHCRWPKGRSEQGARKAKDEPSHGFRIALSRATPP